MKKKVLCLAIIVLLTLCSSVSQQNILVKAQSDPTPTVWIKIHRIQKIDDIENPLEGEADWIYSVRVWDGDQYDTSGYKPPSNNDDIVVNKVHTFEDIMTTSTTVYIDLDEEDWLGAWEVADISSTTPGKRFSCLYNLKSDTFSGDTVITEGGYYKTSGDYDGSITTDENDANLWFTIWDNYESPTADAGSDQWCYSGDKVNFDGSGSMASSGSSITQYEWDFENDGIIDTEGQQTSYTYPTKGQFTVVLKVTDNLGEKDEDTCTISVLNRAPTTSFTYSPSNPSIQDLVNFIDTSEDPDGTLVSWWWSFGDGTTSTLQNPSYQYVDKGDFFVHLIVTDNDDAESSLIRTVTIRNLPPSANFACSPSSPKEGDDIQFNDLSTDPEGKPLSWLWDFGDGYTSEQKNPVHEYTEVGNYGVSLTVTDDEVMTDAISMMVNVAQNLPPVADFTYSATNPKVGENVQFTDSSSDPEGKGLTSWLWDFGDGNTSTIENPTHHYTKVGQYIIDLTVTDDVGVVNSITKTINVREILFYEEQWFYPIIAVILIAIAAVAVLALYKRKSRTATKE